MAGTKPSIDGPLKKIRRARTHLKCLYDQINTYHDPNPYEVVNKTYPEERKYEAWLKVHREPDRLSWGVLLGDYLHNLRSALDQLVGQLVLLSGAKKIGRGSQFPIATTGREYWCPSKDGKPGARDRFLGGVAEQYRTRIDAFQPYRAGDAFAVKWDSLSVLSWLSNVDKHQSIHPAWALIAKDLGPESFDIVGGDEFAIVGIVYEEGPLEDGTKVLTVTFSTQDPNAKMHVKGDLPLDIAFGERGSKGEGIASPILQILGLRVEEIVTSFGDILPPTK